MLTTSKIYDLHDSVQRALPFPMELKDMLDLAARVCPVDAFIDEEFFDALADVEVTEFTENVTAKLAGALRVDPQLMLYELLFMLKNMLQAGLVQLADDSNTFQIVTEVLGDGTVVLEDVYGAG